MSAPRKLFKDRHAILLVLESSVVERLERLKKQHQVAVSGIVRRAVAKYLAECGGPLLP